MGQQEYDAFREYIKQWMLDNSDTYDEFEEMMNSKSNDGYQKIMTHAVALIPKYDEVIRKKMNSSSVEYTLDIEALFSAENLGAKLVAQFENTNKKSIVPAMICWLFFGRSFENMVERGEEMMNNPKVNRFQSFLIARTSKMLVKKSIDLGLRTCEDWEEYNNFRKIIDDNKVLDWALNTQEQPIIPLRRAEGVSALESMLLLDSKNKNILLDKIGEYINAGVKGKRIAFMILALRQLGNLPEITSDRQPFVAIKTHFNTYIGSDKSIYTYLDNGISKQFKADIDNLTAYFKVN